MLSSNITHLYGFEQTDQIVQFPQTLQLLTLGTHFNSSISSFPPPLTRLMFSQHFNKPIDLTHNTNLTHLILGNDFNQPINGLLPNSITHLQIGGMFNHPLDHLPENLTHLVINFDELFQYPLDLPPSLLSFTAPHFNRSFQFPPKIKHLHAKLESNVTLPSTITSLEMYTFNSSPNWLPSSLTRLHITLYSSIPTPSIPTSITHLGFFNLSGSIITLSHLPSNLYLLELIDVICTDKAFPQSLQHLRVLQRFDTSYLFPSLTPNISHLFLPDFPAIIPASITHLSAKANSIRAFIWGSLPSSITHLQFFMQGEEISQFLPPSLLFLALEGGDYNHSIDNFPDSIVTLKINSTKKFTKLPKSLKLLCNCHLVEIPAGFPHVKLVTQLRFPVVTGASSGIQTWLSY